MQIFSVKLRHSGKRLRRARLTQEALDLGQWPGWRAPGDWRHPACQRHWSSGVDHIFTDGNLWATSLLVYPAATALTISNSRPVEMNLIQVRAHEFFSQF